MLFLHHRYRLPATALLAVLPACSGHGRLAGPPVPNAPHPPPARVLFQDVTEGAGIAFKQSNGSCGMRYFVEQVAAGAALLDANGDGNLDIYFPQPKAMGACMGKVPGPLHQRLYLGDGKGHFRLAHDPFGGVETAYGIAAAAGDYDNDGKPDLYVCCFGKNTLFHNRGDGGFEDVTQRAGVAVGGFSTGAVWFDYDGDGRPDLYVLRYCEWDLSKDIPCPGPNGQRDNCNPQIYVPSTNKLFHNNGDGTFTDVTSKMGAAPEHRRSLDAVAADLDGDGRLDLFVTNDLGPNYLFHNRGNGPFQEVAMQEGVATGADGHNQANMGIACGDYNDTGRLSLLVTTFTNEPDTLYRNDGNFYTDASTESGIGPATVDTLAFGTGFIDSRNIGRLDVFVANGHISPFSNLTKAVFTYKERNQLFLNDGGGRFHEAQDALPKDDVRVHRGACLGDMRNDGRTDILVTADDDRPTLLRNASDVGNWLELSLVNRYGNCIPVGTRCTAIIGGRKLLRVVLGGGGYGGDSDPRVHFGLGKASQVDRLEIRWLDGKTDTLANVKANQILKVRESQ